jgi:hypothetical protein
MSEKNKEELKLNWENVKTIEFERVLNLYGMKKGDYCLLQAKKRNWWYEVLMRRPNKIMTYSDIELLANNIRAKNYSL